jgi:DNA-binding FadR family transcriptional regulator
MTEQDLDQQRPSPSPVSPPASGRRTARGGRLGTALVQQLVEDIVGGEFPSGSLLPPEGDLCERFDVSRTVVRESVKVIQEKGLVQTLQGTGTRVTEQRSWNLLDDVVLASLIKQDESMAILDELIIVRAALEREMAGAAARTATATDRERLQAAMDTMRTNTHSVALFAEADVAFHDVVMEISGNRLGLAVVTSIHDRARANVRYHGSYTPELVEITLAEHQRITDAVLTGDDQAADQAMHAHIMDAWTRRRPSTREFLARG